MSLLKGVALLKDLTETEKEELSSFCQGKKLAHREILFSEGDEASAMYFLLKGKIGISKHMDNVNISLGTVQSEEILGEMALFGADAKRMATATALEDCELVVMLSFSIKQLTQTHPELFEKIKQIINKRLLDNKMLERHILRD